MLTGKLPESDSNNPVFHYEKKFSLIAFSLMTYFYQFRQNLTSSVISSDSKTE